MQKAESEVTVVRTGVDFRYTDVVVAGIFGGIVFARLSGRLVPGTFACADRAVQRVESALQPVHAQRTPHVEERESSRAAYQARFMVRLR